MKGTATLIPPKSVVKGVLLRRDGPYCFFCSGLLMFSRAIYAGVTPHMQATVWKVDRSGPKTTDNAVLACYRCFREARYYGALELFEHLYGAGPAESYRGVRRKGSTGWMRAPLRAILGDKCFWCGRLLNFNIWAIKKNHETAASVEHLVPASLGGGDEPLNLALACVRCNHRRRNRRALEFLTNGDGAARRQSPNGNGS